jgi:hypothetical protein
VHDLAGQDNPFKTLTWDRYVGLLDTRHHVHATGHAWWVLLLHGSMRAGLLSSACLLACVLACVHPLARPAVRLQLVLS